MIEKYFSDFFKKIFFNKSQRKCISWINIKLRGFKWTKVKLEDWNEFLRNLEGVFCILAKHKRYNTSW